MLSNTSPPQGVFSLKQVSKSYQKVLAAEPATGAAIGAVTGAAAVYYLLIYPR